MLGQQFYHETMRKVVVSFGTLFNNIHIVRKNNSGTIIQTMKVPLAYGPREKFLVRLRQDADTSSKVAVTLPRIGFEISNLAYDPSRKLNRVQRFSKVKGTTTKQLDTQYMPVPYNLDFSLYTMARNSDDSLQIVEQILPYFQPDYTLTINDMADMGIKRDVPIILNSVGYEDNYQGDFTERRAIIYTLAFTAKFFLYGPVTSTKVINLLLLQQENRDILLHHHHQLLMQMMILDLTKQHLSSKMHKNMTQNQAPIRILKIQSEVTYRYN